MTTMLLEKPIHNVEYIFELPEEPIESFLSLTLNVQYQLLADSRENFEEHGQYINNCLEDIYACAHKYFDSHLYFLRHSNLEIELQQAKLLLEREIIQWLDLSSITKVSNWFEASQYLSNTIKGNKKIFHLLHSYVGNQAQKNELLIFLHLEIVWIELLYGKTRLITNIQKKLFQLLSDKITLNKSSTSNLVFLEAHFICWRTSFKKQLSEKDKALFYNRKKNIPWFAKIIFNIVNMLLTRHKYHRTKLSISNNSVLCKSFIKANLLEAMKGMKRLKLLNENEIIYFKEQININFDTTKDLLNSLAFHRPDLTQDDVYWGLFEAQAIITAATFQYERMLTYFGYSELN